MKVKVKSLSCVQLFVTAWTAAYQAPPSMGFSRQEYWSGLPLPSPQQIIDLYKSFIFLQSPLYNQILDPCCHKRGIIYSSHKNSKKLMENISVRKTENLKNSIVFQIHLREQEKKYLDLAIHEVYFSDGEVHLLIR